MKRTKSKPQPKTKAKKKQVKTTAARKKSKKKALPAPPHILAVAIGDPNNSRTIDSIPKLSIPNPCRPYITGMVDQLMNQSTPRLLGTDYVIDYQECFEGGEDFTVTTNPALILCMSTPVMAAAVAFANNQIPVVGVTSNPGAFPGNVCGVNAQRTSNPVAYYTHFRNHLGHGQTITLLARKGNAVSDYCKDTILGSFPNVSVAEVDFPQGNDPTTPIVDAIGALPANTGLLVLPVDLFFGFSNTINTAAANSGLTVFWPAEEFAQHGQSHYGSSQVECGIIFGEQVDYILTNGAVPTGNLQWVTVNPR
jgi:hypothetical protein